ncbi:hypothetical protein [Bacillus sp. REN10]|uniref:hypothetical protein n=1 Tax=Bacillus sp. REN10 TaxID=2782541 RepID=UPI00193C84A5|nr:hypothetical protein [Bacillus sp. REN10]
MSGQTIRYFTRGNTAKGFYSLLETNLQGIEQLFILDGGTEVDRKVCMQQLAERCREQGMSIELIHCASDPDTLEGIIMPDKQAAVYAFGFSNKEATGVNTQSISIPERKPLSDQAALEIAELEEKADTATAKAYTCFRKALDVHDEWEHIYIQVLDQRKANQLTASIIQQLIPPNDKKKTSAVSKHRFLGAATPRGAVDFINNLTHDLNHRYFIKGRPGSGKSTMMKKIAAAAEEQGYDIEVYHCGFDPNSVDMVIVRELDFAIFDSTAPHEYFPSKPSDSIIDLYEEIIEEGTDEKNVAKINDVADQYSTLMKTATRYLAESKQYKDQIETLYEKRKDPTIVSHVCHHILQKI